MDVIFKVLTTYWNQFLILVALVGYFGNRFFERKFKERELKSTLFQTQKLAAINKFIQIYTGTETMFNQLPYYDIFAGNHTAKELDAMVQPSLNSLRLALNELKLFLKPNELKSYQEINDNVKGLMEILTNLYFNRDKKSDGSCEANEYSFAVQKMIGKNKINLSNIGAEFRSTYL